MIEEVVREVVPGEIYNGKVVKVEEFGCFVELWPGCEGLCHVSQLDWERVEHPSDMFKVGDEIIVKAEGYDNRNRLNLSRKAAIPKPAKKESKKTEKDNEKTSKTKTVSKVKEEVEEAKEDKTKKRTRKTKTTE